MFISNTLNKKTCLTSSFYIHFIGSKIPPGGRSLRGHRGASSNGGGSAPWIRGKGWVFVGEKPMIYGIFWWWDNLSTKTIGNQLEMYARWSKTKNSSINSRWMNIHKHQMMIRIGYVISISSNTELLRFFWLDTFLSGRICWSHRKSTFPTDI